MDENELASSMYPKVTSQLLQQSVAANNGIRSCVPVIALSSDPLPIGSYPHYHEISPLDFKPEPLVYPNGAKKSKLPKCDKCGSYPTYGMNSAEEWRCPVCMHSNSIRENLVFPKSAEYSLELPNQDEPPLYIFAIEPCKYFMENRVVHETIRCLDQWSKTHDGNVSLVSLGRFLTFYDLSSSKGTLFVDSKPETLSVCSTNMAKFEACLSAFRTEKCANMDQMLYNILTSVKKRPICLCLFVEDLPELSSRTIEALKSPNLAIHLFAPNDMKSEQIFEHCIRIRLIDRLQPQIFASQLAQFLRSDHLFDVKLHIFAPKDYSVKEISYSMSVTSDDSLHMGFIDGQSCFAAEFNLEKNTKLAKINCQFAFIATKPSGTRILMVINKVFQTTLKLEYVDGIVFGTYMARRVAFNSFFETSPAAFRSFREESIEKLSKWFSQNSDFNEIPLILQDIPMMFYSIECSNLFSRQSKTRKSCMVNYLTLNTTILRTELYPLLYLPPLEFPNRLRRTSLGSFGLYLIIKGFDCIAIETDDHDHTEDIMKLVSSYGCSLIRLKGQQNLANFLIEDIRGGFESYTLMMVSELTGRRY